MCKTLHPRGLSEKSHEDTQEEKRTARCELKLFIVYNYLFMGDFLDESTSPEAILGVRS